MRPAKKNEAKITISPWRGVGASPLVWYLEDRRRGSSRFSYICFSFAVVHLDLGKSASFPVRGAIGMLVGVGGGGL